MMATHIGQSRTSFAFWTRIVMVDILRMLNFQAPGAETRRFKISFP